MKNKFLILFIVLGTIVLTSMKSDNNVEPDFYPTGIEFGNRTAVYMPTKGGHIVVDIKSPEHKKEVLKELFKQYNTDYLKADKEQKIVLLAGYNKAMADCTWWSVVNINAGTVERQCCVSFAGIYLCWTERCACGYCCNVEI